MSGSGCSSATTATVVKKSVGDLEWNVLPITVNPDSPFEDFKAHVLPLLVPGWIDKPLKCKVFSGGISNKLIGVYMEGNANDMMLIRINGTGTEVFVQRDLEICAMVSLHKAGLIPPVHCQFSNGLCYGYQPGRIITLEEMSDVEMARRTAMCFAKFHATPIPAVYDNCNRLFDFFDWLDIIDESKFNEKIPSKESLKKEAAEIKFIIEQLDSPLVFSHNDTLSGNILYNSDTGEVHLIDFEYGGPNVRQYDIGNHFCEFAGLDISNMDYNRYPNEEFQKKWIEMYFEAVAIIEGKNTDSVTPEKIHKFYQGVGKCALAAHLAWGIWSLLQAQHSDIDFDYMEYAEIRLNEYFKQKQSLLNL